MSSAPDPPTVKKEPLKEKNFENPGLRGAHTTTLFRAVNPELFIKPVRKASRRLVCFPVALVYREEILCRLRRPLSWSWWHAPIILALGRKGGD
jgi:hypothetical protein